MNIFNTVKVPPLILAPMAGAGDNAFRLLCREHGADATVSEMVSAKAVWFEDKKTYALARFEPAERPFILQIFGSEPQIMAHAAKTLYEYCHPDGIDINMGCPVHKIVANREGSALMKNPESVYEIVARVCEAVPVSVSVKIRTGFDAKNLNAVTVAQNAERAGASVVSIHGRTREQMYSGTVDYDTIRRVKAALHIPVVGNGDVVDAESLDKMLATGVDGVMIGRGALGNPFIFEKLRCHLDGVPYTEPTFDIIKETIFHQLELTLKFKPEEVAVREARKHVAWYLKGFRGSAALRDAVNRATTKDEIYKILQ